MCQVEVIIRLKEPNGQMVSETTLATHTFDLLDVESIPREERVDRMEEVTLQEGWAIMRQLFLKQWELIEQQELQRRLDNATAETIQLDGKDSLKVVSRLGILELPRQVCFDPTDAVASAFSKQWVDLADPDRRRSSLDSHAL